MTQIDVDIFARNYDPDQFFKVYRSQVGKHPDFTAQKYREMYIDYCKLMLAEGAGRTQTLQIGGQRLGPSAGSGGGLRPITLAVDNNIALFGIMSCPDGNFQFVDMERISDFQRFVDMGNQGKRMDLVHVYWCSGKYWRHWLRNLLRSQRRGAITFRQATEKLNNAISGGAANLYGWVNGRVLTRSDAEKSGYIDDEANHPGMIDF